MIGAYGHARVTGQSGQPFEFASPHNFIADEDISHTAMDHGFRFAHFLATDADSPIINLAQSDYWALVAFGMGGQVHGSAGYGVCHMF
jgi:hypothetical protein